MCPYDEEQDYFNIILFTRVVLHEFEHVNQNRIIKEENSLESQILSLSVPKLNENINGVVDKNDFIRLTPRTIYYIINYKYVPHEKMTEIETYKKILEIISMDDRKIPKTKSFISDMLKFNKWVQ